MLPKEVTRITHPPQTHDEWRQVVEKQVGGFPESNANGIRTQAKCHVCPKCLPVGACLKYIVSLEIEDDVNAPGQAAQTISQT